MRGYEKPMVIVNDGLSEGVYAASGAAEAANCWTVNPVSVQDWDGSHHVFEIRCVHSNTVQHISTASTVTLTFNNTVTNARTESNFTCTPSGNTVIVERASHANAYQSGDNVTYKVWVQAADEATTKGLACTYATVSCTKTVNVQGNGGDGN